MEDCNKIVFWIAVFLALMAGATHSFAQTPIWMGVKSPLIRGSTSETRIANDSSGNVYVAGMYGEKSITFDTTTLTLAKGSYSEVFLAKYDKQGNVLWSRNSDSSKDGSATVNSIATDQEGNVYVAGNFFSLALTFDGKKVLNSQNKTDPNSFSSGDIYVVKFDTFGNVLWLKSGKASYTESCNDITLDPFGNVYITGGFLGSSIIFGDIKLNNPRFDNGEIFVVKYSPYGDVLWAKSYGGTGNEVSNSISQDAQGNLILTGGFFNSPATFGDITLQNSGSLDCFVLKLDSTGNVLWAKSAGGILRDYGKQVTVDTNGNIYIVGDIQSKPVLFGTVELNTVDSTDIFIGKYNPDGELQWVKSLGGVGIDEVSDITLSANNSIYISGSFTSPTITIDSVFFNAGSDDIVIASFDTEGNTLWAEVVGGSKSEKGLSISYDNYNNIYIMGYFESSTLTFGDTSLDREASAASDIFIAKLHEEHLIKNNPPVKEYPTLSPNPVNDIATFSSVITLSSQVTIDIIDLLGITVSTPFSGFVNEGPYQISFTTAHLAIGMYALRYCVNDDCKIQTFIITH